MAWEEDTEIETDAVGNGYCDTTCDCGSTGSKNNGCKNDAGQLRQEW